jgi:hypothetical protein
LKSNEIIMSRTLRQSRKRKKEKEVSPQQLQQMAGDGETVTTSLPEPDVWTGMA